ncbi:hypothetical protein LNP05_23055 [Klebsiella pneumoniae subsp. pneumoniae]|nr:hypothetical protein [Klebsiella pneumoniae subsp. pneumoniae]
MIQSAVNAWLKEKSYQVVDISHALHQRIDAWRYATWQIYDNIAATSVNTASGGLQETRLKQDVYYLEKPRRKTEALIFGSHDSSTLEMTQKMSDYLDILWGAETIPWSMYYLNGLDNSLILVSTPAVEGPLFELQRVNDQQRRGSHGARKCCCRLIPFDERETFATAPSRLAERALFYVTHHLQPARTPCHGGRLRSAD